MIGIDLSLRSTGLVHINENGELIRFKLVQPSAKEYQDESNLIYNAEEILTFIGRVNPSVIGLEDLSYNSISSSKDLIAGNFWYLRTQLKIHYPEIPLMIVPVLSWRSPLFTKAERSEKKENDKSLKILKDKLKTIKSKKEKQELAKENEELILKSNIKYLTYNKLPDEIKYEFSEYNYNNGLFDLSDAYWIANYIKEIKYGSI